MQKIIFLLLSLIEFSSLYAAYHYHFSLSHCLLEYLKVEDREEEYVRFLVQFNNSLTNYTAKDLFKVKNNVQTLSSILRHKQQFREKFLINEAFPSLRQLEQLRNLYTVGKRSVVIGCALSISMFSFALYQLKDSLEEEEITEGRLTKKGAINALGAAIILGITGTWWFNYNKKRVQELINDYSFYKFLPQRIKAFEEWHKIIKQAEFLSGKHKKRYTINSVKEADFHDESILIPIDATLHSLHTYSIQYD